MCMTTFTLKHPTLQQKFMAAGRFLTQNRRGYYVVKNSKGNHFATVYRLDSGKLMAITTTGQDITNLITLP